MILIDSLYNIPYNNDEEIWMNAITYSAARQNLAKTMEEVCNDHEPVIITSKLLRAISEIENGGGKERELIE